MNFCLSYDAEHNEIQVDTKLVGYNTNSKLFITFNCLRYSYSQDFTKAFYRYLEMGILPIEAYISAIAIVFCVRTSQILNTSPGITNVYDAIKKYINKNTEWYNTISEDIVANKLAKSIDGYELEYFN